MNDAPLVQLRNARKSYGLTLAVDIDSLDVHPGEILCLLGPTGAGKSTLLRMLAGVEFATAGDVRYLGRPHQSTGNSQTSGPGITMVFQRPALLTATVRANVEFGLRLRPRRHDIATNVDRILHALRLGTLADKRASTLSGGQIQLVALARALVLQPDVLLLDEPTANLDPAHVALVEQVIQEHRSQTGQTIVWATHNLFQARRVAQRIALMLEGRLVEVAPTHAFFNTPSDPRTRDFVDGKMIY